MIIDYKNNNLYVDLKTTLLKTVKPFRLNVVILTTLQYR